MKEKFKSILKKLRSMRIVFVSKGDPDYDKCSFTYEMLVDLMKRTLANQDGCVGVPKDEIDNLAETLLPSMVEFFNSEEGKREYEEWLQKKEQKEKEKEAS